MRRKIVTSGKCTYCSQTFHGFSMGRHLESCKERETYLLSGIAGTPGKDSNSSNKSISDMVKTNDRVFLLQVSSRYMPEYWLFVDANASSCKLADIDSLLRRTWLECCGHLSHFTIEDEEYESRPDPDFGSDKDMRVALATILAHGMTFDYEYDYGSTTELVLKVVAVRPGKLRRGQVMLAARNDPISFECMSCRKAAATDVCSVCFWEGPEAMFCASCLKRHKCGEDMALPIVNSPRTGVCGYTG